MELVEEEGRWEVVVPPEGSATRDDVHGDIININ